MISVATMKDRSKNPSNEQVMLRIRSEYLEMPGLRLTCSQAQRLFGIGEQVCAKLLDDLVAHGFLARQANGTYGRLTDGRTDIDDPRRRSAVAYPGTKG